MSPRGPPKNVEVSNERIHVRRLVLVAAHHHPGQRVERDLHHLDALRRLDLLDGLDKGLQVGPGVEQV
jgi:hypothetical protein